MNKKRGIFAIVTIFVVAAVFVFGLYNKKEESLLKGGQKACTLIIDCHSILENSKDSENLDTEFKDGIIFLNENVMFYEGESAIDILKRELKENKIHYEIESSLGEEGAYIEGIANIYEKDFGDLSGWLYRINGEMPDCSASQYEVKENDVIEWVYSCNFNEDF